MKRGTPLPGDGFIVVTTGSGSTAGSGNGMHGYRDAGMTTHRGVVQPDEHFDPEAFLDAVEQHLGFTIADLHSVYARRGGPIPRRLRPLREAIDARLLALLRAGVNMDKLAECCGLNDTVIGRATARGKAAETGG